MIELSAVLSKELSLLPERSKVMVVGEPDLIITLTTPGLAPLSDCLELLGFRVLSLLPLQGARIKSVNERRYNRILRWNTYLGSNPYLLNVDHSSTEVRRWWGEVRYVDINQLPNGTVAAVCDSQRPGFQVPCVWTISEGRLSILAPLTQDANRPIMGT